jgi:trimethylamine:corrinoid methyltransferase-like protein
MRPTIRFLSDELIDRIVAEARDILHRLGMEIHNEQLLALLAEHGAKVDQTAQRALFPDALIDQALRAAPRSFKLYDVLGNQTHDFSGYNVPAPQRSTSSTARRIRSARRRRPITSVTPRSSAACRTSPRKAPRSSPRMSTRISPTASVSILA